MKKLVLILALIAVMAFPGIALATSNITNAVYRGVITVTNNSTATSGVSVNCSINSTALIAAGLMSASANDCAVRSTSGADVSFMPGYNGAPWVFYAGDMAENEIDSLLLYTKNVTGGEYAIFPGAAGANVTDTASLEHGNVFADNITSIAPNGQYRGILTKPNAYEILRDGLNDGVAAVSINSTSSISFPTGTDDADRDAYGVNWVGQTFTVSTAQVFYQMRIYCRRTGNPGDLTISIYNTTAGLPTGSPLISRTVSANGYNLANAINGINFSTQFVLLPGVYAWVASCPSGDAANKLTFRGDASAPAYADGNLVTSANSGAAWTAVAGTDLIFYVDGTISAVATGVSESEVLYGATANSTHLKFYIDGVLQSTTALGAATVPDNANAWKIGVNTPCFSTVNMTVGGVQVASWQYQYAATITDTISEITLNPNYRTTSSDADVSASLDFFGPVTEAKAPGYTLDDPPDFVSSNITVSSGFTTSVNGTATNFPLKTVIEAVSVGGQTPSQLAFLILFLFVSSAGGLIIVRGLRESNVANGSCFIVALWLLVCYGVGRGLKIIDLWMLIAYIMLVLGILLASRERGPGN